MRRYITFLIATSLAISLFAETYSLNQCIEYAIEHNLSLQIEQVNIRQGEHAIAQAKQGYHPNVSASSGQSWNLGRGLTAENTYADRNTSSFNWGVNANMPIFDGLATPRRIAYAKANLRQITSRFEAAKDDLTLNIIAAYLQALYTKEMYEVSQHQIDLSEYELNRQITLAEAGKIPEADLLDAEAQLASDKYTQSQAYNDMILARVDLMQLLHLNTDVYEFDIEPLDEEAAMIIPADEAYRLALQHNHTIEAARCGIDVAESNMAVAKSGYLPSLSFGTSIGSTYYRISGMPNESFGSQMRHNYSTYFGFNLSIPIYDGGSTRNQIKQAEIERLNAELQLDQASEQLYRTIQQAYLQAVGASKKLETSTVSERAALNAFEAAREKYSIGRAKPVEYQQAKAKALQATADRIQAGYELILRTRILQFYANN